MGILNQKRSYALCFPALFSAALVACVGLFGEKLRAHEVSSVSLITHLDTEEGTYLLDAAMEVVPSDDDLRNEQIPPEEAAREFAEEYLVTMFNRMEETPELEISVESASDDGTPEELQQKQVSVRMSGEIPAGSSEFLVYLESTCPMAVVMVVIKDEVTSRRMQVILPGEYSRPVNILPVLEGDPFEMGESVPEEAGEEENNAAFSTEKAPGGFGIGWFAFWQVSFLPTALAASLFLMTTQRRPLFLQFGSFMIAMSLAISLGISELLPVPRWGPMAMAILLILLAGECLIHIQVRIWRYLLSFLAGLSTGASIANAMSLNVGSVRDGGDFASLVSIVLGAEFALIAAGLLAAAFFLTMGRFDWYRKSVVTPIAVVLVALGIFTLVEPYL